MGLNGETVLVTGAAGFIGGRLAEKLIIEHGCHVRTLVRSFGSAVWLSRTNAEIIQGDLSQPDILHQAVQGCSIVFHCAANSSLDEAAAFETNVTGTRNLLEAAKKAGVERFVYVSSVAVHDDTGKKIIVSEATPRIDQDGSIYARSKLAGEEEAAHFGQQNDLKVVILRPTMVYGPRASLWTVDYTKRIVQRRFAFSKTIQGVHNFVYVDDVVQALVQAAKADLPSGEAFIIGSADSQSWLNYLEMYTEIADTSLDLWPLWALRLSAFIFNKLDCWIETLRSKEQAFTNLLAFGLRGFRKVLRPWRKLSLWEMEFYNEEHRYDTRKAREILGFQPAFPPQVVKPLLIRWLREQGYLPENKA